VKLYAPEAILLSSVDPSIHEGTAAIREYYANAKVQASGSKVEISERRMRVLSDVAVVCTGLWEFTFMRDG
jgi:ketosteroid isomerase-like protein